MLLPQQIQAILYHFMMGWFYGCTFSFLCSLSTYIRSVFIKTIVELIYHIGFTLLLFEGLYHINGGITNLYLLVIFIIGVCIYYKWYLLIITDISHTLRMFVKPFFKKFAIVKLRILGIINIRLKRLRRSAKHGKEKQKDHEQEETA